MPGNDAQTKLLLHCNGADTSTTFTDSSVAAPTHTVTANGNAQLETAVKKWGTASGLFDGTGDDLTTPDSTDWDVVADNTSDYTIDLQIKHADHTGSEYYMEQREDGSNRWALIHVDGAGLRWFARSTADGIFINVDGGEITDTNWHHIAMIKVGSDYGVYKDGTQISYVSSSVEADFTGTLYIGNNGVDSAPFDGNMDEVRIQADNYFGAAPNVGLTDTITVPTEEYAEVVAVTGRSQAVIIA